MENSNSQGSSISYNDYNIDCDLVHTLPTKIKHFIWFEAPASIDIRTMLKYKEEYGLSWNELLWQLKDFGYKIHKDVFGGEYPDPEREEP